MQKIILAQADRTSSAAGIREDCRMLTYPDMPTHGWPMPRDVVARDVIVARRRERLLADVRSSRADFLRETRSRRRLLTTLKPPPTADPLIVEIEKQWTRLYADYGRYRRAIPFPGEKGCR